MENTPESMQNWGVRLENWINRQTWNFAQHWLVWVNGLIGIFVGLPYLAPILMSAGFTTAAAMIYRAYSVTCHQMPERSFFIFGYKAAFCQRDTAIWLAMFGGGNAVSAGTEAAAKSAAPLVDSGVNPHWA